jgi:CHRD domain
MRYRVLMAVMGSLLALPTVAKAEQIGALLTGYEESPSVSTTATGEFTATIAPDGEVIQYSETFSGLQAPVTQSHIHSPSRA